ncbi:hypothetical protein K9N68_07690 [Kovacikia minuta CCNUW1]|uniref:hypothetical protein n=1 Tax=Kovacikia minuta TaxID=2931930 RepID=UPI001CCDC580|nr:hypothetical protein [Kovacikia minuta]UBF27786.1 hypothetical protein K9N68_07690 [Kovacikia minuta CCNUW1]
MTASQPNFLELAKQGDASAIAGLINHSFQPQGITAKVSLKADCLKVMLEAVQVPDQQASVELIRQAIVGLKSTSVKQVKVFGREVGEDFPSWQTEFEIPAQTVPDLTELAKQGDIDAISRLIAEWLNPQSVTVKVSLKDGCLRVMLEAVGVPDQQIVVPLILDRVRSLGIQGCTKVKISGREPGDDFPDWQQDFDLEKQSNSTALVPVEPSPLVAETASQASNLERTPTQESSFWGSVFGAVAGAAGAVGGAAAYAGGAVAGTVTGTAGAIGGATVQAGGAIAGAAGAVGNTVLQSTDGAGYVLDMISSSPQLQNLTKALKVDWLLKIVDQVDVVQAEAHVKNLQRKYPNEKSGEIAHRVMVEKALYVGGSGFASSLLPGFATAMLAVDLAATTALQAEMVYQIACVYGLNPHESARKGEVLAIFGLALGGNYALKAGLGFARNIPVAGALIGASSNAAMLYALGYAACQFYEAKLNPATSQSAFQASQAESEKFLKGAIAQQVIMDQILVYVVLANHPGKTWEQILPQVQTLNFSPASLEVIAANAKSPPSLEALLNEISSDFAVPLLAQCQKIVQQDGVVTPEEAKTIATITNKLNITLATIA